MSDQKNIPTINFGKLTSLFNYLWIFLIFILNFAGSPHLKWVLVGYTGFVLFSSLFLSFKDSFPIILTFCFIEGQGRILWEYNPLFRVAFDLVLGIALIKSFVSKIEFKVTDALPPAMMLMIFFHYLWYFVELFNPNSLSIVATIAATKIYLFPFLLFILFRRNRDIFTLDWLQGLGTLLVVIFLLESILSIYQTLKLDDLMLSISPYYSKAMRGEIFSALRFRPFGTTHIPGGISIYIVLPLGMLFLRKKIGMPYLLVLSVLFGLISITLLASQVRSAMVKGGLIVFGSIFATILASRLKKKAKAFIFASSLMAITISMLGLVYYLNQNQLFNLSAGLQRWQMISSVQDLKAKRLGPIDAAFVAIEKIKNYPIGIGPGMTGAVSSFTADLFAKDPIYTIDTLWSYDNLFLYLIVEFGIGAIFYIALILSFPVLLLRRFFIIHSRGDLANSKMILISLISIVVIILGNWGGLGIPYNPESFFFWFWAAVGMNAYDNSQREMSANVSTTYPKDNNKLSNLRLLTTR